VFKVKRLLYAAFFALSLQSSFVFGDVYSTDTFLMHKLCISNPWNGTNFKGDAMSTFPCHYDYAIVHVPTLLNETSGQILNSKVSVKLEIDSPDIDKFLEYFIAGFEITLIGLMDIWLLGFFFRHVIDLFRFARKR